MTSESKVAAQAARTTPVAATAVGMSSAAAAEQTIPAHVDQDDVNIRSWLLVVAAYLGVACAVSFIYTDSTWWRALGIAAGILGVLLTFSAIIKPVSPDRDGQPQVKSDLLGPFFTIGWKWLLLVLALVALRWLVGGIESAWLANLVFYGGLLAIVLFALNAVLQILLVLALGIFMVHIWTDFSAIRTGDVTLTESSKYVAGRLVSTGPISQALNIRDRHADGFYLRYVMKVDPRDEDVNILARQLVRDTNNEPLAKTEAIFAFVREEIQYVSDPVGRGDYPRPPLHTLEAKSGDCEDQSILLCSLLGSVGLRTYMAFVPRHVFVLVEIDDPRIPEDLKPFATIDGRPVYALEPTGRNNRIGQTSLGPADVLRVFDVETQSAVPFRFRDDRIQDRR